MADITYDSRTEVLEAFGRDIEVSNFVRLNNSGEPIFTRNNEPIKPQHFPKGNWRVTDPLARTQDDLAPWFIPTDAWQMVEEWELTPAKLYDKPTGRLVRDDAYGIHYSVLDFTWGCIRVIRLSDLQWLVGQIQIALDALATIDPKERWISLEVI